MKRIVLILAILLGASFVAGAQEDGRNTGVFVGAGTGMNLGFDGLKYDEREASHAGAGFAVDAYVGGFFNKVAGLRAGWQGYSISDKYTDFGNRPYNYIHGDLLLRPHKSIVMYVHGGYVKVVNPVFGAGVGILFPIHLGDRLSIVPDLKATAYSSHAFAVKERNVAMTLSGTIGLSYRFGGRRKHVEPVIVGPDIPDVPTTTIIRDTVVVKEIVNTETIVRDTVYVEKPDTTIMHPEKISALALFDTDKSIIRKEAFPDLNKIVAWFAVYPEATAVIEGHTDSQASAEYNQGLSERRAKAVYDYLVNHGVDAKRLTWVGYGLTRPVDTNETPEGRQKNRRVEIHVE